MMPETEQMDQLGAQGDRCASCGAGLDTDQRYCLNCGTRRAGPRLDFERHMAAPPVAVQGAPLAMSPPPGEVPTLPAVPIAEGAPRNDWTPFAAVSILAGLGVMLVIGVLIGRGNSDAPGPPVVVQGGGAPTTADTTAAPDANAGASSVKTATGPFKSDWPSGKTGYTVEVGSLPKAGSSAADVAAAKSDVAGKGAKDVGALDSDQYPSLPGGSYVVYSGVYDTKAEATKALASLKGDFPAAKVVKVSATAATPASTTTTPGKTPAKTTNTAQDLINAGSKNQPVTATDNSLNQLNNQSGESYENTIKHLPDQIATQGAPPPIDTSTAPGGSDPGPTTVIK